MPLHIYELEWRDDIIDKVARKHGLTVAEVEQAFIEDPDRVAQWTTEKERKHGRRLEVVGSSWTGKVIHGYLDPVDPDDGVWRVRTARRVE